MTTFQDSLRDLVLYEEDTLQFTVTTPPDQHGFLLFIGSKLAKVVMRESGQTFNHFTYEWTAEFYAGDAALHLVHQNRHRPIGVLRVQPRTTKLDSDAYAQMLSEIETWHIDHFVNASPITTPKRSAVLGPRHYTVVAEQICQLWPSLMRALQVIQKSSRKSLTPSRHQRPLDRTGSASVRTWRSYITGRKSLPVSDGFETRIRVVEPQLTENTLENIAIRGFLGDIGRLIIEILDYFVGDAFYLEYELKYIHRQLVRILATMPFSGITSSDTRPWPSMVF